MAAFPTDQNGNPLSAEEVYRLIGGKVLAAHENNPDAFRNACTLRMSRALIYAGIKIPYIKGATLTGADGYNYIFRASDMYKWLSKPSVFGAPDISTSNIAQIKGMQGIYIMQAHYPANFGAWGHVTLYNGYDFIGNGYIGEPVVHLGDIDFNIINVSVKDKLIYVLNHC